MDMGDVRNRSKEMRKERRPFCCDGAFGMYRSEPPIPQTYTSHDVVKTAR